MRRKYFYFLILLITIFILKGCTDKTEKISIIHSDYIKGQVLPKENNGVLEGGMSLMASGIDYFKEKHQGEELIIIDTGSSISGSVHSFYTEGEVIIDLMNNMDYDILEIGHREFHFGKSILKNLEEKADFDFLGANIISKSSGEPFFKEYLIKETTEGTKIVLIGLCYENTPNITLKKNVENLEFKKGKETLDKLLPKLEKSSDIIVLLSNLEPNNNKELAKLYGNRIDLIVARTNNEPFSKKPININGVDIVMTLGQTKSLGCYTLVYNQQKGIVDRNWEHIEINSKNFKPNHKIGNLISNYSEKLNNILGETIGSSVNGLKHDNYQESEVSNFLADIILEKTKADISFVNGGAIRADFKKDINKKNIHNVFPFPNSVSLIELKGEDIKKLLERSVSFDNRPLFPGGLRLKYDLSKEKYNRLVEVKVNGHNLDDNKYYKVATLDYIVHGGDGYKEFKNGRNLKYLYSMKLLITDYIKKNSPVDAKVDGRFVEINGSKVSR